MSTNKLKIYDCSINKFAPTHRKYSMGNKQNDIMADLKLYANKLNIVFVNSYKQADAIITNTTYTPDIVKYANQNNVPLIKRMDGVFWQKNLIKRNQHLNKAATLSDAVIFISKFSQNSFKKLYPHLKLKKNMLC